MQRRQVARRIRFYMKRAGISRAELATRVGVTEQAVHQWWTCEESQPTLINLAKIARVCGLTLSEFLGPLPRVIKDDEAADDEPEEDDGDRKAAP